MDELIAVLRTVHILSGIAAALTFWIPLVSAKGGRLHRRVGMAYVACMLAAAVTAILLTPLRLMTRSAEDWPLTLLMAYGGVVAFAAATMGVRVLREASREAPSRSVAQHAIVFVLFLSSLGLAAFSFARGFWLGVGMSVLGAVLAFRQARLLRSTSMAMGRRWWVQAHIGQMLGSCMATLTAAFVNNGIRWLGFEAVWVWTIPVAVLLPLLVVMKRRYREA